MEETKEAGSHGIYRILPCHFNTSAYVEMPQQTYFIMAGVFRRLNEDFGITGSTCVRVLPWMSLWKEKYWEGSLETVGGSRENFGSKPRRHVVSVPENRYHFWRHSFYRYRSNDMKNKGPLPTTDRI
jgi:hypothetical protein